MIQKLITATLKFDNEMATWPYFYMVYAQTRIHSGEWEAQTSLWFRDKKKRSFNPDQKNRPSDFQLKKNKRKEGQVFGHCLRTKNKRRYQTFSQNPCRIREVKLATLVEGDPKDTFLIVTTPMNGGGCYSIPRIAPLYPWSAPYCAQC